jgi:N-methylhydantoinase B
MNHLKPGDVIINDAPGGGGYGDPLNRDTEQVERDVMNGYVTIESARQSYGVDINPQTMKVNGEKTNTLRKSLRKDA